MSTVSRTRRQIMAGAAALMAFVMAPVVYAKEALYRFKVKTSEILFDGPKAVIANKNMAGAVKKNKAGAVKSLSEDLGELKAGDVSLDASGRVVIANEQAVGKLKTLLEMKPRGGGSDFLDFRCVNGRC